MVATTPRRVRGGRLERPERPQLDIEVIAEEAQFEELSSGIEQLKGEGEERPSISIPGTAIKLATEGDISIVKVSVPDREADQEQVLYGEEKKRRSYLADVKDAIKKSRQKVHERTKKRTEEASIEKVRGDQSVKRLSSLSGAATVGLFTPLQLSAKERGSTPAQGAGWEQDMDNIINEIKRQSPERPAVREEEKHVGEPKEKVEPEAPKAPSYTIMTKKVRQRKVATKEQENAFNEMIQSGRPRAVEDYKLGIKEVLKK